MNAIEAFDEARKIVGDKNGKVTVNVRELREVFAVAQGYKDRVTDLERQLAEARGARNDNQVR